MMAMLFFSVFSPVLLFRVSFRAFLYKVVTVRRTDAGVAVHRSVAF
jgi:hypothetical protein